jgi:hypothetical protein
MDDYDFYEQPPWGFGSCHAVWHESEMSPGDQRVEQLRKTVEEITRKPLPPQISRKIGFY